MIHAPSPGSGDTRFKVDLDRLHDVEPQAGLRLLPPSALSRAVVGRSLRCVPYPLLGENTLCVSDSLVLGTDREGAPALLVRVGDTYPNQHLEVVVKAYLYKWRHPRPAGVGTGGGVDGPDAWGGGGGGFGGGGGGGQTSLPGFGAAGAIPPPTPPSPTTPSAGLACSEPDDFEVIPLDMGYDTGADRLSLWLPVVAKHVIGPASPLAPWLEPGGLLRDADACVAVTVEAYRYATATNAMRTRIFSVLRDVRPGSAFLPIVTSPGDSADHKPRVNWARFHDTVPLAPGAPGAAFSAPVAGGVGAAPMAAAAQRRGGVRGAGAARPAARRGWGRGRRRAAGRSSRGRGRRGARAAGAPPARPSAP